MTDISRECGISIVALETEDSGSSGTATEVPLVTQNSMLLVKAMGSNHVGIKFPASVAIGTYVEVHYTGYENGSGLRLYIFSGAGNELGGWIPYGTFSKYRYVGTVSGHGQDGTIVDGWRGV
jgi:hypothetical protein